jgi:hypothetical protein
MTMDMITVSIRQFLDADVDITGPLRPDIVVGGVYEFYQGTAQPAYQPIDGDEYDLDYFANSTSK